MLTITVEALRKLANNDAAVLDYIVQQEQNGRPAIEKAQSAVSAAVKGTRRAIAKAIDVRETK